MHLGHQQEWDAAANHMQVDGLTGLDTKEAVASEKTG